jgi:tetratricopeptide (TPR) repeat protein
MINFNIKSFNKIIFAKWILLFIFVVFVGFTLSSCTTPKSVGYNLNIKKNNKTASNKEESKTQSKQVESADKPDKAPQTDKNSKNNNDLTFNEERLPTLREQMKMIQDKQETMENEVQEIKTNIQDINSKLNEIKQIISTSEAYQPKDIITGENPSTTKKDEKKKANPTTKLDNSDLQKEVIEGTYIMSDEEIEKSKGNKAIEKKDTKKIHSISPESKKKNLKVVNGQKSTKEQDLDKNKINNEKLSKVEPEKSDINQKEVSKIIDLGENYLANKEYAKAEEYYKNILIKVPDAQKGNIEVKLAESLLQQGKIDEAREIYQEIIQKKNKNESLPIAKKMLQQL